MTPYYQLKLPLVLFNWAGKTNFILPITIINYHLLITCYEYFHKFLFLFKLDLVITNFIAVCINPWSTQFSTNIEINTFPNVLIFLGVTSHIETPFTSSCTQMPFTLCLNYRKYCIRVGKSLFLILIFFRIFNNSFAQILCKLNTKELKE